MPYEATLLMRQFVTHDVQRLLLTRPDGLDWQPGQGIELAIDKYVCGPDGFVEAMNDALRTIGVPAEKLVYER